MTTPSFRTLRTGIAGLLAAAALHAEPIATVKADRTNLRAKPAFDGEVIATLQKGETVAVLDQVPGTGTDGQPRDWAKVALPKQVPVWVYAPLVDAKTRLVKQKFLNLRAGPGKNYSEMGELKQGDAVTVIRELDGWLQIEPPAGTVAFVAASLIETAPGKTAAPKPTRQVSLPERSSPPVPAPESKPLPAQSQPVATETVKPPAPVPTPVAEPAPPVVTEPAPLAVAKPAVTTPIYSNPVVAPAPVVNPAVAADAPPAPRKFLRYQPPTHSVPVDKDFVPSVANTDVKPREVLREGIVGRAWNVQAPGHLELLSLHDEGKLDFLFSDNPELDLTQFRNRRVVVTGEEWRDSRWKTPLLKVKTIQAAE